jgi:hypothetical protein
MTANAFAAGLNSSRPQSKKVDPKAYQANLQERIRKMTRNPSTRIAPISDKIQNADTISDCFSSDDDGRGQFELKIDQLDDT